MGEYDSPPTDQAVLDLILQGDTIRVQVPIHCDAYQRFLEANAFREQSREDTGYITPEAQEAYIQAIDEVIQFGRILRWGT